MSVVAENPNLEKYNNKKIILSTSITLVSRILGSSMLTGGYNFRYIGLVPSVVIMIISITAYVLFNKCIVDAIYYTNSRSYNDLVKILLNSKMAMLFNISIMIDSHGTLVSFQIVAARSIIDLLKKYFPTIPYSYQTMKFILMPVIAVLFCYPLTLLKSMKNLRRISPFTVGLIFCLVLSINFFFARSLFNNGSVCTYPENVVLHNDYQLFSALSPVFQVMSYMKYIPMIQKVVSTSSLPIVFTDLRGPLQVKRKVLYSALKVAFTVCCVFYFSSSFEIAIAFGSNNKPSMLQSFSPCGFVWMDIIQIAFSIFLTVSYPLILQPALLVELQLAKKSATDYKFQVLFSAFSVLFTTTLAVLLDNIAAIFGLFTSVTGMLMYFFIPVVAFFKLPQLKRQSEVQSVREQLKHPEIINRGLSFVKPAVDSNDLLQGDSEVVSAEVCEEFKEYDYSKEYSKVNMRVRKVYAISIVSIFAVCSGVAFWLNLMDFFK